MKVTRPVKQSWTTVRFEVILVHWSEVHLEANTEGNIVPSVAEYVLVQAVADGSVKIHNVSQLAHLRFVRLSNIKFLQCHIQGDFFNWYPPKKLKYGKPRLGESTLT